MPKYTVQGVRFGASGFTVYVVVRYKHGAVRFAHVTVPWGHFDDSDAWALYSRDAKRRAESDGDGWPEPALPLDWS